MPCRVNFGHASGASIKDLEEIFDYYFVIGLAYINVGSDKPPTLSPPCALPNRFRITFFEELRSLATRLASLSSLFSSEKGWNIKLCAAGIIIRGIIILEVLSVFTR
ncbi:MAG: hypothetical protein UZ21_OP11001001180 [Microgenomates bacterium OLB22]|nr:MAG: hypothetical protein UZ21_OP11001001180 [Microgenomates bacterium OLB22]